MSTLSSVRAVLVGKPEVLAPDEKDSAQQHDRAVNYVRCGVSRETLCRLSYTAYGEGRRICAAHTEATLLPQSQ